jgi:hypothetical protein
VAYVLDFHGRILSLDIIWVDATHYGDYSILGICEGNALIKRADRKRLAMNV